MYSISVLQTILTVIPSCVPSAQHEDPRTGSPPFSSGWISHGGRIHVPQPGVQQRTLCGEPMRKETIDTWATTLALRNMYGETSLAKNGGKKKLLLLLLLL